MNKIILDDLTAALHASASFIDLTQDFYSSSDL